MSSPLTGISVLFLGGIGPGPFAAMMLADMGAQVTRVVRPGNPPAVVPHSILYRGQEVLEADLKDPVDVDKLRERLVTTDILIEGFRPGVAERLGLGPEEAQAINPALVYGRITGWGQSGPLAHTAGHDINYIAVSGALHSIAGSDGAPVPPVNFLGDFGGGSMYLVTGLLAGVLQAKNTGRGCVVDAAIVDGAANLTAMLHAFRAEGQWQERGTNLLDGGAPFYSVYRTADEKWMAAGAIEPQFYALMMKGLGLEQELSGYEQNDRDAWPTMKKIIAQRFAKKTQAEWIDIFRGSDACVTEVVSPEDVLAHPHLAARETYVESAGHTEPSAAPRFL